MPQAKITSKLTGGDRRSVGRVSEVVADVLAEPALMPELFDGMLDPDPVVRMRAADAVEKVSVEHPGWLKPFKRRLLRQVAKSEQQEVRWHVAQMVPRLALNRAEREAARQILLGYLDDRSGIVRTFSMQALADLAEHDEELRAEVVALIERLTETGTPAVRSRGRKLLKQLARTRSRRAP